MNVNTFLNTILSTDSPGAENGLKLLLRLKASDPENYADLSKELLKILDGWNLPPAGYKLGELLIKHDPAWPEANYDVIRRLAIILESSGPLEERATLTEAMALLPERKQPLALERCQERDKLAQLLLDRGAHSQILSLIRVSAGRWTPEGSNIADLVWLMDLLLAVRISSAGAYADVTVLTCAGPVAKQSRALLETMATETCYASALAYIRCLRGPAGPEHCKKLSHFGHDPLLGDELAEVFRTDPAALALALEEDLLSGLFDRDKLYQLKDSGIKAAGYCLRVFEDGNRGPESFVK